jgi:GMP synthase (glutamine-hydrolysing)
MDTIVILDFGGQYSHLIANRIRRLGVYSEILPPDTAADDLRRFKGIIFSGGPHSVTVDNSPWIDPKTLELGIPILGLCYGHQLIAKALGGVVARGDSCEYGLALMDLVGNSPIFKGIDGTQRIWMSHGDAIQSLPAGFTTIASTEDCLQTGVADEARKIYGFQFHPEVTDTPSGMTMLGNFIDICQCERSWNSQKFLKQIKRDIVEQCGDRKVFLLVSGGVDSTVAFALLNEILGPERVYGLHVDIGMMRHQESADIMDYMKEHGFDNLDVVDATDQFLAALEGLTEPEQKRGVIGRMFLEVKVKEETRLGLNADEWILGQGTIYPDTIESAGTEHADKIKTHHNRVDKVLELIEKGLIIEPLCQLYKDEVRQLGEALGLPRKLVWRHPFPGPGLGVRLLCSDGVEEVPDAASVDKVRRIANGMEYQSSVLPIKSVGVQGDGRTYAHPALLLGDLDWTALEQVSTRITNQVSGVNRVLYGISISGEANYTLIKGYMTKDRLDTLRAIDDAVTQTIFESGEYEEIWQMPVVLLPMVNAAGEQCVVLRPIQSQEAMTARFHPLKPESIERIVAAAKAIDGVGDVFFDVTHKPPGTIEWE